MTEFMNTEGGGPEARSRRSQQGAHAGAQPETSEERAPKARRKREAAPEEVPGQAQFVTLATALRMSAALEHPMRDSLRQLRDQLKSFATEANRESGPIGFLSRGPDPVSISVVRSCCREVADRLEEHVQFLGDGTARALKLRLLAQAAQTEIQEFDIYLTQGNFRGGLVSEGELAGVLTAVNALKGNLGQRLVEFDAILASLDG